MGQKREKYPERNKEYGILGGNARHVPVEEERQVPHE